MNILIIAKGSVQKRLIELCLESKFLKHLYTASKEPIKSITNIKYENFEELCEKAKALQVDVTIVADKNLIENNITDYFKKNLLNIISVNKKWSNLETIRTAAKQLLTYYSIKTPAIIKAPTKFPIVLKTNIPYRSKIVSTMDDLIREVENLGAKETFLEQYLNGQEFFITSLWDGKNILFLNSKKRLTEVQEERLELLKTKFKFLFSDEMPDFIGLFTIKLIWSENDWYVLDFIMRLDESFEDSVINHDFLYILNAMIYQKLNEIE